VNDVAVDPLTDYFVSGSDDKTVRVWIAREGRWECVKTFREHTDAVPCVDIRNHVVISGSHDGSVKLFDIRLGKCVGTLSEHSAAVMCLQFEQGGANDCTNIVSGSRDNSVKLWDIREMKSVHTFRDHQDWVRRLHFDKNCIISGSYDNCLKVCCQL
jgi:F-box and WD-40 domain protein 7